MDGMDLEMFPFLWCKVLRGENYGGLGGKSLVPYIISTYIQSRCSGEIDIIIIMVIYARVMLPICLFQYTDV